MPKTPGATGSKRFQFLLIFRLHMINLEKYKALKTLEKEHKAVGSARHASLHNGFTTKLMLTVEGERNKQKIFYREHDVLFMVL